MSTDERRARVAMTAHGYVGSPEALRAMKEWNGYFHIVRAIRESDEAAGMVLVPREATENMQQAGEYAWMHRNLNNPNSNPLQDCYRAMLAAATEADHG